MPSPSAAIVTGDPLQPCSPNRTVNGASPPGGQSSSLWPAVAAPDTTTDTLACTVAPLASVATTVNVANAGSTGTSSTTVSPCTGALTAGTPNCGGNGTLTTTSPVPPSTEARTHTESVVTTVPEVGSR